ncbi:MAG: strawberry notch C-terminal domain-containing protein [Rhodobacteraceae bacterium]|nr:strawberry notch C-terminal domain-containing protein [Paracoccaceae bacterium]
MTQDIPATKTFPWIKFPHSQVSLHRVNRVESHGLLLIISSLDSVNDLQKVLEEYGFWKIANQQSFFLPVEADTLNKDLMAELAQALGGESCTISEIELSQPPILIDEQVESSLLNTEWIKPLGVNAKGHEIFNYISGNRYRKITSKEGVTTLEIEQTKLPNSYYLRIASLDDCPAMAAGILRAAELHRINESDLRDLSTIGLEQFRHGLEQPSKEQVFQKVKSELPNQLLQLAVQRKGDRKVYHQALQVANNLGDLVETYNSEEKGFSPNIQFLIFLRRLTQNYSEVNFNGSEQLSIALPFIKTEKNTSLQVYDLTKVSDDGLIERVANALQKRKAKGQSVFLFDHKIFGESDRFRHEIGKSYSFEIVVQMPPHVVANNRTEKFFTMVIIGNKRQHVLDTLPQAVLRTQSLESTEDLDRVYQEILRSKRRVKEWEKELVGTPTPDFEENERQRLYKPLSTMNKSHTMIPKALETPTTKALTRVTIHIGKDIDGIVANWMGVTKQKLRSQLLAEQVDAVAMAQCAFNRNRGFLLADQTGIGKGRALAALALIAIRQGKKVIYFTENSEINIPDVWRDLKAVGALNQLKPMILASKPVVLSWQKESADLLTPKSPVRTLSAKKKNALFFSGRWPANHNIIFTNYSQFRGKDTADSTTWAKTAVDKNTLVILDESQNAINQNSRTGKVIRSMISRIGRSNALYATATPMRDKHSADLYKPLLPNVEGFRLNNFLEIKSSGGESAQESFTSMLAEDGVYLRRDHDLSNIDFQVRLPDDSTMSRYVEEMNKFSPLVEKILDCSIQINLYLNRYSGHYFQRLIEEGVTRSAAHAEVVSSISHFSPGGPMSRLARLMINSLKVDQVIQEVVNEIREGRKPLITFHSTGEMLLAELIAQDSSLAQGKEIHLSIIDQLRRVTQKMFTDRSSENIDLRVENDDIRELSLEIDTLIDGICPELPAFPIDYIVAKLDQLGIACGEISGRSLAYKNNCIQRRKNYGRYETIHKFNSGELDVLIYNMAGATGGSYHASSEFKDRRPRTLIEMETPLDIIKYVQAQGRSNRYGQVSRPRVASVMTGLASEMRILQQRNRKLRAMGASVDGNRSHPLLLDDIPDFLNNIGDRSAKQVLETHPQLARRLGFQGRTEFQDATNGGFANKVLSRSIVLNTTDQANLIDLIRYEFDAIIEELNSHNSNPLKPQEIPGNIEIKARTLYEGNETDIDDIEKSSFLSPLYIETGIHHYNEKPITSDELRQMVSKSIISDGSDGFIKYANTLKTNFPTYMQDLLDPSTTLEEAVDNIYVQSRAFQSRFRRLQFLSYLLENIKPGIVLQYDETWNDKDNSLRTVVKLNCPKLQHAYLPQAYRIHTITPGDSKPKLLDLSRLMSYGKHAIRFQTGLSQGDNFRHLQDFNLQSLQERNFPVQILTGNHLAAIQEANRHKLGSLSLYRDMNGTVHRGVVIHKKSRDLSKLPVLVPSSRVAKVLVSLLMNRKVKDNSLTFEITSGLENIGRIVLHYRHHDNSLYGQFYFPFEEPVQGRNGEGIFEEDSFYFKRQELGKLFCQEIDEYSTEQNYKELAFEWDKEMFNTIFSSLDDLPLYCYYWHREIVSQVITNLDNGEIPPEYQSFLPID